MEHVLSVRPTGKFPEKVENLKRWSRFPGWNFRTECRVLFTLLVVCTSSRSTDGHPATYRGWDQMEQLFTNQKFHFCYHRNFRVFFANGKRPRFPFFISPNELNATTDNSISKGPPRSYSLVNTRTTYLTAPLQNTTSSSHMTPEFPR